MRILIKILFILIVFTSCKKGDCDVLNNRIDVTFVEYNKASTLNRDNPTTENKERAIEKFILYKF